MTRVSTFVFANEEAPQLSVLEVPEGITIYRITARQGEAKKIATINRFHLAHSGIARKIEIDPRRLRHIARQLDDPVWFAIGDGNRHNHDEHRFYWPAKEAAA